MKTASNPDNPHKEICRQAAKAFAGEHWFPLNVRTKKLITMLEEQRFLEPRGNSDTVGRVIQETTTNPAQLDRLEQSA